MIVSDEHTTLTLRTIVDPAISAATLPDLHLAGTLVTPNFSARVPSIWLSTRAWERFLVDLRSLRDGGRKEARTESMSPADFALRIVVADAAGHIRAAGHLGSDIIGRNTTDRARVPFQIEIDPARLIDILASFEALQPASTTDAVALRGYMSSLSEEAFAAGWMRDLEFILWAALLGGAHRVGRLDLSDGQIDRLRELSAGCNGWIRSDAESGREVFVPLAEWEGYISNRR